MSFEIFDNNEYNFRKDNPAQPHTDFQYNGEAYMVPNIIRPAGKDFYPKAVRSEAKATTYNPPSFYERETARGTELVGMNCSEAIACRSDETKRIATFGLLGCTAAVTMEKSNGERRGYIQHYSPQYEDTSVEALTKELRTNAHDLTSARLIIMTPGILGPSRKFPLDPVNSALANSLKATGTLYLGEEADIQVYAYQQSQEFGATDQGTLLIGLPVAGPAHILADGRLLRVLPKID